MFSRVIRGNRVFTQLAFVFCIFSLGCDSASVKSSIVDQVDDKNKGPQATSPVVEQKEAKQDAKTEPSREDKSPRGHALVVEPTGEPLGVVVMMHGYNSNQYDFGKVAKLAAEHGLVAVSLQAPIKNAPERFQWEKDDLPATHDYVQEQMDKALEGLNLKQSARRVWLMGFSQGGLYAALLSEMYPDDYVGALAVAPAGWASIPDECGPRGKDKVVWVVTGSNERPRFAKKTEAARGYLEGCKHLAGVIRHDGGHQFPPNWAREFGQVFQGWVKE